MFRGIGKTEASRTVHDDTKKLECKECGGDSAIKVLDELTKGRKWTPAQVKWKFSKDGLRWSCMVRGRGEEGKGEGESLNFSLSLSL